MTISTRTFVLLGLMAAGQSFGGCDGYTNLGDPPAAGAGGEDDGGNGIETGGTGGPSTSSGGHSAQTGNGGSSTNRGGNTVGTGGASLGGASPGGGGAAGSGAASVGGGETGGSGSGSGGSGDGPGDGGVPMGGSMPDAGPMPDGGTPPACAVDACNDHGACVDRTRWSLCDCDAETLPVCELPLFREIGPSRSNDELLLVSLSGDGKMIVGLHQPRGSTAPRYGVKWTLDGGLERLEQAPDGPTVAWGANFDGSLIRGQVETLDRDILREVVWRNGVLGIPSDMDPSPLRPMRHIPTIAEFEELLEDVGIDGAWWDIWVVNDISDDGKVIFGLGMLPDRSSRWLLRLP